MAKKPAKNDRQAVIEQIRKKQKGSERRRGLMIVGVCVVVALLIVGAAAFKPIKDWWDLRQFEDKELSEIGAAASVCGDIETKPAEGQQDHVPEGTPLVYTDAPPAFGRHYDIPDAMERKLYTVDDRPDLGKLVHNLEHGYTVLWYDETAADDESMMKDLRALSSKFEGTTNQRNKFKAVPWTEEDGEPFPDGQHIALTHWSVSGKDHGADTEQVGVWQYCSEPSGAALEQFMLDFPYMDSPEPNGM